MLQESGAVLRAKFAIGESAVFRGRALVSWMMREVVLLRFQGLVGQGA
jgi:hypothetical protein